MASKNEEKDIFTLTDEEGNESDFEFIADIEYDGNVYVALAPVDGEEDDEYVILRRDMEGGEEIFSTVDDDDEFDAVADMFENMFWDECDLDAEAPENEDDEED